MCHRGKNRSVTMTWGMITFWGSQLVEYQIKPGERRMESVEGKRREKRLSISRGKLLQVKPRVNLAVCSPFLNSKTEKSARRARRSNTGFSLYDRRFKLLLYRLKQTRFSSGLYFILYRDQNMWVALWEKRAQLVYLVFGNKQWYWGCRCGTRAVTSEAAR